MEGINIHVDWPYFLGIMASLIGIAWYSSSRFSKIETNIYWLKETFTEVKKKVDDIKVENENETTKVFATQSPVQLTHRGNELLVDSGLKEYIDKHREELVTRCKTGKCANAYEVQECVFSMFDSLKFEADFDTRLKTFAYEKGLSIEILRRVGAIYCRDICLDEFHMDVEDIDKHSPDK